ncbi:MAG: hypothetical protein CMC07_03265 [Flavobacteriaceae bacterium]|jgi:hypothetical protein|nr:hypothetical protein [Flavobacteriaceae bacterium]HBY67022.1 hypothetical protein [Flavobacteriaceae bacterium]|tara:strand:+ start:248768 stop:249946 length:1179 start_codon:yes stop_codon:yes gene_type:complete
MRAFLFTIVAVLVLSACSSVKRNQKFIAEGDYDRAIDLAVKKLQKDKYADKNDEHIILLEEAYKKAVSENTRRINFLKKSNEPNKSRSIYYLYKKLEDRQFQIRPLLPLYSNSLGRKVNFKFQDYSNEIIAAKQAYVADLYNEALRLKNNNTIEDYRESYYLLCDIAELHPNYREVNSLLEETRFLGTDFIFVSLNNRTNQVIPFRMERELLDFNTYGLNNFWTEFHSKRENGIDYNYAIVLNLQNIGISPERVSEREERRSQRIKDGWEYKKDRNGNFVLDENGDKIKIDKYKTVSARMFITTQVKSVLVAGDVVYRDLLNNQNINSYPLSSEFVFENIFATFRGDRGALTNEDLRFIQNRFVPFPTNEQMVLDAGEDIKIRLKEILKNNF